MRSSMNISLPTTLRRWIEHQVEIRGFDTASEFVRDMIRREREKTLRVQIDETLCKALQTPLREMTDDDWDDIRRQGRKLATKRKKS
jgi:antitoxin ParD1/3/4